MLLLFLLLCVMDPATHAQGYPPYCDTNGHLYNSDCPNYGLCVGCEANYNAEVGQCVWYEFVCFWDAWVDYQRCIIALNCIGQGGVFLEKSPHPFVRPRDAPRIEEPATIKDLRVYPIYAKRPKE